MDERTLREGEGESYRWKDLGKQVVLASVDFCSISDFSISVNCSGDIIDKSRAAAPRWLKLLSSHFLGAHNFQDRYVIFAEKLSIGLVDIPIHFGISDFSFGSERLTMTMTRSPLNFIIRKIYME